MAIWISAKFQIFYFNHTKALYRLFKLKFIFRLLICINICIPLSPNSWYAHQTAYYRKFGYRVRNDGKGLFRFHFLYLWRLQNQDSFFRITNRLTRLLCHIRNLKIKKNGKYSVIIVQCQLLSVQDTNLDQSAGIYMFITNTRV